MRCWLPDLVLPLVILLLNLIRTCSLLTIVVVTAPRLPLTTEIGTLPPIAVKAPALAASSTVESPRLDLARSIDDLVGFRWLFWGRDLFPPITVDELLSMGTWDKSLKVVACCWESFWTLQLCSKPERVWLLRLWSEPTPPKLLVLWATLNLCRAVFVGFELLGYSATEVFVDEFRPMLYFLEKSLEGR